MDEALQVVITIAVLVFSAFGSGGGGNEGTCGGYAASDEVCAQVMAQAGQEWTVPEGHEQRERARGR